MTHIDKNSLKHFGICYLLSLEGEHGVCIAIGALLTKEYYDKKTYGHWCWFDILFDTLGCILGYGTRCLIFK